MLFSDRWSSHSFSPFRGFFEVQNGLFFFPLFEYLGFFVFGEVACGGWYLAAPGVGLRVLWHPCDASLCDKLIIIITCWLRRCRAGVYHHNRNLARPGGHWAESPTYPAEYSATCRILDASDLSMALTGKTETA